MRGKKIGLAIVLLLFIVSLTGAFAATFSVDSVAVQNRIFSDEVAQFTLTIANHGSMTDRYTIVTSDPSWRLVYDSDVITLNPGQSQAVPIRLTPTQFVQEGKVYAVPVSVKSLSSGEVNDLDLQVILDSSSIRQYKPAVAVALVAGDNNNVDPTGSVDLTLHFSNKNPLNIPNLQVQVSSPFFTSQFVTSLAGNDELTKIVSVRMNPQTAPQTFFIDVNLVANNISLGQVLRQQAHIVSAEPGFTRVVKSDINQFLYHEYVVELTNPGNVQSTETIQMQSSLWQRLFTKSDFPVTYEKGSDGKYYADFAVTIGPGAGVEFAVVQNYKPFFYTTAALVLIILISTVLYFTFRSSIIVTKKIQVAAGEEEGVSRLKVVLNVKNRTGSTLENVKIVERTPNITEVDKQFIVGTLKPTKIVQNAVKGTLVRWDFASLEPFEERIITYNVNSKLPILGTMQLPPTLVKYDRSGKTRTVSDSSHEDFI